jgi:ribosomal protein S18 acetylase RimI-like enzyme
MTIREAERHDARGIAEVHVRSWRAAYVGIVPAAELARLSVKEREKLWAQFLAKGERSTSVLVNQELVVGWAGFGPPRDEDCHPALVAELYGLYLLPEYWGLGLGRQLYGLIETRMRRSPVQSLVLWVFERNTRARCFYEARGYQLESGMEDEMSFVEASVKIVRYRKIL